MGENNKGKKKSRRMKERKETTLLTDKFLSLKNIASAVALYLFFFFFCGRGGVPGPMITSCLSTKKIMLPKFLDIDSSGRTNCPICGTRKRRPLS